MLGAARVLSNYCQNRSGVPGRTVFIAAAVASGVLTSCNLVAAEKEPPQVAVFAGQSAPLSKASLGTALRGYTGYSLGSRIDEAKRTELRICAAKMRYGNATDSKIAQLYCSNRKTGSVDLRKFWINFTAPDHGHKAWKIMLSLSGGQPIYSDLVGSLTTTYGTPKKVADPVSYSWQDGDIYLILKEDKFGYQIELWDRSLNTLFQ